MTDIRAIQKELRASGIDAWLFYDFSHRDPIAYRVLELSGTLVKRRWFYLIPARGTPRKLVHRIEAGTLDGLPGTKRLYAAREELEAGLRQLVGGRRVVAMQYSPRNNNPYIGMVDAGTVELVKSGGVKVVSSADLVQKFEARWTPVHLKSHFAAGRVIDKVVAQAFARAGDFLRRGRRLTEYDLQLWMVERFGAEGIVADGRAIVAAGRNSGNPHYDLTPRTAAEIRPGKVLLLDVWGKTKGADSVYYDITWTGFAGDRVPAKVNKIFQIVREARDSAIQFVEQAASEGRRIQGWQVDRACRDVIERAGYGRWFTHRTGHNIGREVHGNGANMDDLEMHDDRQVLPRTCFSIEPGVYLPEFGIRSEVDVYVDERRAGVTGAVQAAVIPLMGVTPAKGRKR